MPSGPRFFRALSAFVFVWFAVGCFAVGCNLDNPGDAPPRATLYFPNGLALSPHDDTTPARFLYVANSDFDLRYSAGTIQAYSLDEIEDQIAGCKDRNDPECTVKPLDAIVDEVPVAAFSTGLAASPSGDLLLMSARTSDSLPYVRANPDADGDDVLRCEDQGARCGLEAVRGRDRYKDDGNLEWPSDPVSVTAGMLSDFVEDGVAFDPGKDADEYALVAHRNGAVSLFVEDGGGLLLTDVRDRLVFGATDLAYDPDSGFVYATEFLSARPRGLARFGVVVPEKLDGKPDPLNAYVYDAGSVVLQPVDSLRDTRAIAFLPGQTDMGDALATPNTLIASQHPSALLLADVTRADSGELGNNVPKIARVKGMTQLGVGASRVIAAVIKGVPIAIVASFEARELALIDLRTMLTRSVIPNLSGPFDIEIDAARERVYCTDFRSSVVRIIDIAPALDARSSEPVEVIATLGTPRVLQELR